MKKYVRGQILAGQIIALTIFSYLTLNYFVVSYAFSHVNGGKPYSSLAFLVGVSCVVEVITSIYGIVRSVVPYGKFKRRAALTSTIYDGIFGLILFIGLFQNSTSPNPGLNAIIMLFLFSSMALLISGMVKAGKEAIHMRPYQPEAMQPRANYFGNDDFVPLAVPPHTQTITPATVPTQSPETNQTEADLAKLKKLFESQLITEDEYTEKKKEILNRDFSAK